MKRKHARRQNPVAVVVASLFFTVGFITLAWPLSYLNVVSHPTTTKAPAVTVIIAAPEAEGSAPTTTTFTIPAPTTTTLPGTSTTESLPTPNTTVAATSTATTAPVLSVDVGVEATVTALVDDLRKSHGLPALPTNSELQEYARDHAWRMATVQAVVHSDIGSLLDGWKQVGENVGLGNDAATVVSALAASPSHLEIMLGNYEADGVGVVVDGSGAIWVCHVFASTEAILSATVTVPTIPNATVPRLPIN